MPHKTLSLICLLWFFSCLHPAWAENLQIKQPDVTVDITYGSIDKPQLLPRLTQKITQSIDMVRRYYGRFPVPSIGVTVMGGSGTGIQRGKIFQGQQAPQVIIWTGQSISPQQFRDDWIISHEIIHSALPDLPNQHEWLEEGLPTYLEPIIKAQAGHASAEQVWRAFYHQMPQGQPAANDQGLDKTPTWGRTYWGGATFCLLADVAIRQASNNKASLRDAVKNITQAGLNLNQNATIQETLKHMDNTAAGPVVSALYRKHAFTPSPFELDKLWRDLGIRFDTGNKRVVFNDQAPLAHIRKAMTQN